MNHTWQTLTSYVLDNGHIVSPRGKRTIELLDVTYSMPPTIHFDSRPTRNLSLNYVFREFLWFCKADRHDVRMQDYAPIWKTCLQWDGGINSNYGQYLFQGGIESPFCSALSHLVKDQDSRRCWIPIFQTFHQTWPQHEDYPCTTGIGFRIRGTALEMVVHMRSQDLWWGASNDEPVCYLIQLMAQAYLAMRGLVLDVGEIVHKIDSLHLYERHWDKAQAAAVDFEQRPDVEGVTDLCKMGFNGLDLTYLLDRQYYGFSPLLSYVMHIPGAYGNEDLP